LKVSQRNKYLLKRFGITDDEYVDLLRKQEGRCAVCKRTAETFARRLAVDHDHKTGEIRGLLCLHCNRYVVGRHRRENGAELLKAAFEYLTGEYHGYIVPPKIKKKKRRARLEKDDERQLPRRPIRRRRLLRRKKDVGIA